MPITYEITDSGRFVHTKAISRITERELLASQAAILSDPRLRPGYYELFDGTMAYGSELSEDVITKIVAVDQANVDKLAGGKCAIVLRSDFELAELFELLHGGPHEVTVFFNLDVARAWLGQPD